MPTGFREPNSTQNYPEKAQKITHESDKKDQSQVIGDKMDFKVKMKLHADDPMPDKKSAIFSKIGSFEIK